MVTHLKVTLVKSSIGQCERVRSTIKGLGLRRIGRSRVVQNTPAVRGMVKKIMHLIDVEEISG